MNELDFEKNKLIDVVSEYGEYLDDLNLKYKNIYKLYSNYEEAEVQRQYLKNKINIVNQNINKPYFARIDFENKSDNILDSCYIGKVGIMNLDNKIITVDWRSPIANLYYDSNVGEVSYTVDDKVIEGNLLLKRQYNIENKQLLSFNDVDTVSNDELLKPYLGVNMDKRLKNIVSTIQSEQNEIIRSSITKNLIVQGVAGSGKTTVALHRIAYLVYTYKNIIENNQYMVIGPNKFFINYISSVLPDLDVNDVKQYDLIEFTSSYLNKKIVIKDGYTNLSKYKSSLKYKKDIDNYLINLNDNMINNRDIKINDYVLIKNDYIKTLWKELDEKKYKSLNLKIDRIILLLNKYLDNNIIKKIFEINNHYDSKLTSTNIDNIRKERTSTLESLKKNKSSIINKYFARLNINVLDSYKEILKITDQSLTNFELYYEDIPGLLYLNYRINGSMEYDKIKHIVIDEAQDYNEFTFYSLKKILNNATFSIYGDLAQSLYPYRSLNDWNEIKDNIYSNIDIKYLNKSYRTSIEIMNEANKINSFLNLNLADAVIRHSEQVTYKKVLNLYKELENKINDLINNGMVSIAIITKDNHESNNIYEQLKDKFNLSIVDENNLEYNSGIIIITSKLSKGLEFDSVIISDASEEIYNSNDNLDLKLLYVAMTRAIHNLIILYSKNLNTVLKSVDIKNLKEYYHS